jgi:hypothetical protein
VSAQPVSSLLNPCRVQSGTGASWKTITTHATSSLLLTPISISKSLLVLARRRSNTINSTSAELSLAGFRSPSACQQLPCAREAVAGHNMSNQFIGLTMLVTLNSPPGAQLRGIVSSVEPGKSLTLRHGTNPPRLPTRLDSC